MMNPVILTEVDKKYANMPNTSFNELFVYADDPAIANQTTFRSMFSVVKVEPANVCEWTHSFDKKTKKQ